MANPLSTAEIAVGSPDLLLTRRDKDELIALIRRMLRQAPELEVLLELPPARSAAAEGEGNGDGPPAGAEVYRDRAIAAFRRSGEERRPPHIVAIDLDVIKGLGDEALEAGDHSAASVVYQGVLAGILARYATAHDDDGEIAQVVDECVEGLGCCLDLEEDPARRESSLGAMFAVYRFDIDQGGVGLGDEVPGLILNDAGTEEKARVAGWVRDALATADGHRRRLLGAFLLDLEAESLDDDAYLAICRETGRSIDLIDRLLSLGRDDEARAALEEVDDAERDEAADLFAKHARRGRTAG